MQSFLASARPFRALFAFALAYCAACLLFSHAAGAAGKFMPTMYVGKWLFFLVLVGAVQVMIMSARWFGSGRPHGPLEESLSLWAPRFGAGMLLCTCMALVHGSYTSVKTIVPDLFPFRYDSLFADLDFALHGTDPWRMLRWLDPISSILQPIYSVGWLLLVVLVTTFVATGRSDVRRKQQYAWSFALCWILLGNLVSSLLLAAGPVYYERVTGSARFGDLASHVAQQDGALSAYRVQEHLWTAYNEHLVGLASGISAFPSMHVAMATLFALQAWHAGRILRYAALAFAGLILLGSVYLGWHYAVDGYASIIGTIGIWKAVGWALNGYRLPNWAPSRARRLNHARG